MSNKIKKTIVVLNPDQANKVFAIGQFLDCSNTRALQFSISYSYNIDSLPSRKIWGASNEPAINYYIPMSGEQIEFKNKFTFKNRMEFKELCVASINNVYEAINHEKFDKFNQAWKKYVPKFVKKNEKKEGWSK